MPKNTLFNSTEREISFKEAHDIVTGGDYDPWGCDRIYVYTDSGIHKINSLQNLQRLENICKIVYKRTTL